MVFKEIITIYSEQHMKHIITLSGKNGKSLMLMHVIQYRPRCLTGLSKK